jgi:CTP synthase
VPFEENGMVFSGLSPDGKLVEMIELPTHPWFIGCQFHPELKSRPTRPHPLFASFIRAAAQIGGYLQSDRPVSSLAASG